MQDEEEMSYRERKDGERKRKEEREETVAALEQRNCNRATRGNIISGALNDIVWSDRVAGGEPNKWRTHRHSMETPAYPTLLIIWPYDCIIYGLHIYHKSHTHGSQCG